MHDRAFGQGAVRKTDVVFGAAFASAVMFGLGAVVIAIGHLRLNVGQDAGSFCSDVRPGSYSYVGESPSVSYSLSVLPFGVECRYGNPVEISVFHDLATVPLAIGLALLLASVLIGVTWLATVFLRSGRRRKRERVSRVDEPSADNIAE